MGLEDSVIREGEEEGLRERRERVAVRMKREGGGFACGDRWGSIRNILLSILQKFPH